MPQFAAPDETSPRMETKPTLETLFESEEGPLLGFAYGIVGRREVAEELVQDGFFRLHEHWDTVENPRAWIYRAVRNLCLSHLRKHSRETISEDTGLRTADENPEPDEALGRREAIGMVRLFLSELPEKDRQLIHLKYHEDLRYSDIGKQTGLTVGNVGYRMHHLLRGLASSLRSAGINGSRG